VIKFAFQHWSEKYQWYVPNTIEEFSIEKGNLPATHGLSWFKIPSEFYFRFKHEKDLTEVFASPAWTVDALSLNENIEFVNLSNIGDDESYIFPIIIKNINYFSDYENVGLKYVSPRVFDDVKHNRAKIVFIMAYEGSSGAGNSSSVRGLRDFEIINNWCKSNGLIKNQVYYINGNQLSGDLTTDMNFTGIPIDVFYGWITLIDVKIVDFSPTPEKYLFLSYNRIMRVHRTVMMCLLIRNNLIDQGLISYGGANLKNFSLPWLETNGVNGFNEEAVKLDKLVPMYLDMDLIQNNPASNVHHPHYETTFISVVTETLFTEGTIFFSEKIWKTISVGHPFFVIGSVGFLKQLRKQGYKTFGKWIDESYDDEPDLVKRTEIIIAELLRLSKMSISELSTIRNEMRTVLEHNKQLFNSNWRDRIENKPYEFVIYREIEKICSTLK
jgi:hypothetical protein